MEEKNELKMSKNYETSSEEESDDLIETYFDKKGN